MNLEAIQAALRDAGFDGWLFYDFHNRDRIAYKILGLDPAKMTSRRWFYFIPREGNPVKIVHAVERTKLDTLPGKGFIYLSWEKQHELLRSILGERKKIAMQYSPLNNIPYISIVDAGTVELLRSFGHEILSSADLVQTFEALIGEEGYSLHLQAGRIVDRIRKEAFDRIRAAVRVGATLTEYDLQQFILKRFSEENLMTANPPIVGVNDHPADPHFEPTPANTRPFKKGDTVLIDLWAKKNVPGGIYYDITWCGFVGSSPPGKYLRIFSVVCDARRAAVKFLKDRLGSGKPCFGWEVDEACRNVVRDAGFGDFFVHRTGHSIGEEDHGNGVNIDNLETKDERLLVPGCLFSIEPGIYLEGEMAVRTEINVYINGNREVVVTGEEQDEIVLL